MQYFKINITNIKAKSIDHWFQIIFQKYTRNISRVVFSGANFLTLLAKIRISHKLVSVALIFTNDHGTSYATYNYWKMACYKSNYTQYKVCNFVWTKTCNSNILNYFIKICLWNWPNYMSNYTCVCETQMPQAAIKSTSEKISKSHILTPNPCQGHVMSRKCKQPLDEPKVQVWLLYDNTNF